MADDDPELLASIAEALENCGATVTSANNGGELLETLGERDPFDLVVTDISMPWMTGLQAMQSTRYAGLTTPTVVITALRDEQIPDRVRALGSNAVLLHKPFDLEALERAIDHVMPELEQRAS